MCVGVWVWYGWNACVYESRWVVMCVCVCVVCVCVCVCVGLCVCVGGIGG